MAFLYGCKVGWISAFIYSFLLNRSTPVRTSQNEISWMTSASYTSSIISVILCYNVGGKFGRKTFLRCVAILYMILWATIFFTSSMMVIIICFGMYGIASSTQYIISYAYIGEVASPKNREIIGVVYNMASTIGLLLELCLSSYFNFNMLALFPFCASIFALIMSTLMVESPYYLANKGKNELALRNLCFLNNRHGENEVLADLETVREYVNEQATNQGGKTKLQIVLMPENLKLTVIMIFVSGLSAMHTSNLITSTGVYILKDFQNYVNGNVFLNMIISTKGLLQFCSIFTIKRFNRRTLFLVGYPICGLLQLTCGLCFYIQSQNGNTIGWLAHVIAYLLAAHLIVNSLTYGLALELLKMEIFPYKMKEFYSSLMLFTGDWFIFAQIQSYFLLEPILGNHFWLFLYTICSFAAVSIIFFFIQDTKGKTLLQIRTDINEELRVNTENDELESLSSKE